MAKSQKSKPANISAKTTVTNATGKAAKFDNKGGNKGGNQTSSANTTGQRSAEDSARQGKKR